MQQGKARKKRRYWFRYCRADKWWVDMMLAVAPVEELWKNNFWLSRAKFDEICNELRPYISPNILSPNHRTLPVQKKVAAVLYFLKDTGSMNMTTNTFGLHQCALTKAVKEVCSVIVTYIVTKRIKLLNSQDEMLSKMSEFEAKFGMTQAFRCIRWCSHSLKSTRSKISRLLLLQTILSTECSRRLQLQILLYGLWL